jgi:hypothetical protein
MPDPIEYNAAVVDLSARFKRTTTVVASPAAAAETIIASLTILDDLVVAQGIRLEGWAAYTVGTNGTATQLRIRQTNVAGTVKGDTGALTGGVAAAGLLAQDVIGFDAAPVLPGQVYVLTLQVTAGSAPSTVSSVFLGAIII